MMCMQSAASAMQPERDSAMYSIIGILAPMIIKEIEEVGNRACRFVLVPKNKTELGFQVSFDELVSGQHAYCVAPRGADEDLIYEREKRDIYTR